MDAEPAVRFKQHIERGIEELFRALALAQEASPAEEFLRLRTSVGDIIARIDTMLHDKIYKDHSGLDGMYERLTANVRSGLNSPRDLRSADGE